MKPKNIHEKMPQDFPGSLSTINVMRHVYRVVVVGPPMYIRDFSLLFIFDPQDALSYVVLSTNVGRLYCDHEFKALL